MRRHRDGGGAANPGSLHPACDAPDAHKISHDVIAGFEGLVKVTNTVKILT
jgi:hypothetical protein